MNGLGTDFVAVMEQIVTLCRELVRIGETKRAALTSRGVTDLEAITGEEEQLILHIGKADQRRRSILKKLSETADLPPGKSTAERILPLLDEEDSRRFLAAMAEWKQVSKKLVRLNALNAKLIEQNLAYIGLSLNLLTQEKTTGASYAPQGQASQSPNRRLFDHKV